MKYYINQYSIMMSLKGGSVYHFFVAVHEFCNGVVFELDLEKEFSKKD